MLTNILQSIGRTPLLRLNALGARITRIDDCE